MSSKRILRVLTSRQVMAVRQAAHEDGMTVDELLGGAVEDYLNLRRMQIESDREHAHFVATHPEVYAQAEG